MLPAFSISASYQRDVNDESTESSDICRALAGLESWSVEAGIDWQPSFAEPALQAEQQAQNEAFIREYRLIPRIKRWILGEPDPPPNKETLSKVLHLTEHMHVHRRDYETDVEFANAAILAMDSVRQENFMAMGRRARNRLVISLWRRPWDDFSCWLRLYRFDEKELVIQATMISTDAYEDKSFQISAKTHLAKLESSGEFRILEPH